MSKEVVTQHAAEHGAPTNDAVAPPPNLLIRAHNLVKHYGTTQAVRDLSFAVARGEVVGFLGPNGAGKSTTMKMLTGFLRPTSGSAHIAGFDVAENALQARQHLGYLPENAPLYDDMMVIDFLRFVAEIRGVPVSLQRSRLGEVAERCGLLQVLGKDIGTLSKGFRQRVGLAQALVHNPDLLVLDEPTSGLDPNQIVEIRALIRDLGRDKTVLLSTHILSEVRAVCSRAMIIANGAIVADDTPQALVQSGGAAKVYLTLSARGGHALDPEAVLAQLQAQAGVRKAQSTGSAHGGEYGFLVRSEPGHDVRGSLFELAVARNWCVLEMRREQASLEETFQRLTGAQHHKEAMPHAA